jgi:hypothetical protein
MTNDPSAALYLLCLGTGLGLPAQAVHCFAVHPARSGMSFSGNRIISDPTSGGINTMHARVTQFELKPETAEQANARVEQTRREVMKIPGIRGYINLRSYDGTQGVAITFYESAEQADTATQPALQQWIKFTEFFESTPESRGYNVLVKDLK